MIKFLEILITRVVLARQYYFIPQIAAVVFAYLAWLAFDRTPPLILYDGKVIPQQVKVGQPDIKVMWRAHFSGRDCGGYSQREIVLMHGRYLWAEMKRARAGIFQADSDNPREGTVITPALVIPPMLFGPAGYRVTQFYYCNWLQRTLDWPIIQVSPFVQFEIVQ